MCEKTIKIWRRDVKRQNKKIASENFMIEGLDYEIDEKGCLSCSCEQNEQNNEHDKIENKNKNYSYILGKREHEFSISHSKYSEFINITKENIKRVVQLQKIMKLSGSLKEYRRYSITIGKSNHRLSINLDIYSNAYGYYFKICTHLHVNYYSKKRV